jgi:hypothetical protein
MLKRLQGREDPIEAATWPGAEAAPGSRHRRGESNETGDRAQMSHTFTDENLLTWEAFASSGNFGLATRPRIVFNCLSEPDIPPRYLERSGNAADAEEQVIELDEQQLRRMLREARPLD